MATICVFGDSIAWGAYDPESGGWVQRLRNFVESSVDEEIDVYNLGISGDTTEGLILRFKTECEARQPDVIIFAIGINDSYIVNGASQVPPERFEQNLSDLLEQANSFTKEIIFVGLTPVDEAIVGQFYQNEEIYKYNQILKDVAHDNGLPFIKIFELLSVQDLDEDGLHPNSLGHHKIFEAVKSGLFES